MVVSENSLDTFFDEQMQSPGFRAHWMLQPIYQEACEQLKRTRKERGLTKKEAAKLFKTSLKKYKALEDISQATFSLLTLARMADIFNLHLVVQLEEKYVSAKKSVL